MQIICLDFESYFAKGFELKGGIVYPDGVTRRSTMEAYIRDPRFQTHCVAIKQNGTTKAHGGEHEVRNALERIDWADTACLCHHAQFDGAILNHRYGIKPAFWLDTFSMASAMLGNHIRVGLESLAKHFGLRPKSVPYNLFKGRYWHELDPWIQQRVLAGACDDVEITWQLFGKLINGFPRDELDLIDMTVRMYTEPVLYGDTALLAEIWQEEKQAKDDILAELGITANDLRSDDLFTALLEAEGVEVAYKQGKSGMIPCFAKTDDFMEELQNDDDPRISGLAAARVQIKSNAVQSRAETLGWMASRGPLPIYLRYCGAHTTRWAGGDGSNFQNNKRGHRLRSAVFTRDGDLLGTPDASQIECRLLNTLAGQQSIIDLFRNGGDPYLALASEIYQRKVDRSEEAERGTGKQGELSCGYGCGAARFQRVAALGTYGPPAKISIGFAQFCVNTYRDTHNKVVDYWRSGERILWYLYNRNELDWGPMHIQDARIWLPNGLPLIYETLERVQDEETGQTDWSFKTRRGYTKMYGAKLVENVVQALARVKIGQDMLRIKRETGLRSVSMSHDEPWLVLPDSSEAPALLQFCVSVLASSPAWLPQAPLAAEGKMGKRYAK